MLAETSYQFTFDLDVWGLPRSGGRYAPCTDTAPDNVRTLETQVLSHIESFLTSWEHKQSQRSCSTAKSTVESLGASSLPLAAGSGRPNYIIQDRGQGEQDEGFGLGPGSKRSENTLSTRC